MGVLAMDNKQLTSFYSSENSIGKQLYADIHASDKKILGVDISKTGVTSTQWATLADELQITIKDLVATDHPDFKKEYGKESINLENEYWLKILEKQPHLLKNPIMVFGEKHMLLENAASFKKYLDGDSAMLDKPYK